eukprot:498501-Prorocentrum_minimum.AAC.1
MQPILTAEGDGRPGPIRHGKCGYIPKTGQSDAALLYIDVYVIQYGNAVIHEAHHTDHPASALHWVSTASVGGQ